jgi:hypothetical protein
MYSLIKKGTNGGAALDHCIKICGKWREKDENFSPATLCCSSACIDVNWRDYGTSLISSKNEYRFSYRIFSNKYIDDRKKLESFVYVCI